MFPDGKDYQCLIITVLKLAYSIMEPVERGATMKDYLRSQVNPTLVKGLTELCHQKPDDPLVRKHCDTK